VDKQGGLSEDELLQVGVRVRVTVRFRVRVRARVRARVRTSYCRLGLP